jgi:hypothetical protein
MRIILSLLILVAFLVESTFFVLSVVQGKDIDDRYFRKYRGNNLFWFTLAKATTVALVIYLILFPGGLILGSGRLGGYIIGGLYVFIAGRFLGNYLAYGRKQV